MKFDLDDAITTLGQIATPVATAFTIARRLTLTHDFPAWAAVISAVGVEAVGVGISRIALRQWDVNGKSALPFGIALLIIYALIASALIGVFEGTIDLILFPWLTIIGSAAAGWHSTGKRASQRRETAENLERQAELRREEHARTDKLEMQRLRAQLKHEETLARLKLELEPHRAQAQAQTQTRPKVQSSVTSQLVELFEQDPSLSGSEAARIVGASPSRANRVRREVLARNGNSHESLT